MCIQVGTQNEKDTWVAACKAGTFLDPCEAPSKDGTAKKKKQTVGMGMQKGLASATADSSVGKAVWFLLFPLLYFPLLCYCPLLSRCCAFLLLFFFTL
jgi:hypothetical protein